MKKIVLAYSGGLDTTVILHWLKSEGFEVIALCLDLGQAEPDFDALREKALKTGAIEAMVLDVKKEFVENYVWPCLFMNACYEGNYLLGTAMARPLVAQKQIEIAEKFGANYIAHGATGKGNDQARFEIGCLSLKPDINVISPWKIPEFYNKYPGRSELLAYAKQHSLPVKATVQSPWSSDDNLFHISFEAGILEDPWVKPPPEMFEKSLSPQDAPDKVVEIKITFEAGIPVALNDKKIGAVQLMQELNEIAGRCGVGRVDLVESRFVGMKSRGVYETPAGTVLQHAHRQIESITLTGDVISLKDSLLSRFSELVYNGFWFSPQMELLLGLARSSQEQVYGEVKLELYKGNIICTGRRSENSLYNFDLASMEKDQGHYSPLDAKGFIKLNALPFIVHQQRKKNK